VIEMEKGQFNIEYLSGFIIFIFFASFVAFSVASVLPKYHLYNTKNSLQARGFGITEIMIKTNDDFQIGGVTYHVGLANAPYELDTTRLNSFVSDCNSNYEGLKEALGLDYSNDFYFRVVSGVNLWECGKRREPLKAILATTERYVTVGGNKGSLLFRLW